MATQSQPSLPEYIDTSRYERIDGRLVERPSPNKDHSDVQFALSALLRRLTKPFGYQVGQEWTLDEDEQSRHNWMTPDVVVAPAEARLAKSRHLLPPALLAVEVLSEDQTFPEMHLKALRYFRWGVQHVWIIDPVGRNALSLTATSPEAGTVFSEGYLEAGDLRLSLDDIFNFEL